MTHNATAHIGTSGYAYDNWCGRFYPDDLAGDDRLSFYAGHFDTVEINNSFYKLPDHDTVKNWCDETPARFRFAPKVSRYLSHMKKLNDAPEIVGNFLDAVSPLAHKKGPVLLQLPHNLGPAYERLDKTLAAFRDYDDTHRWKVAVECRNSDWYGDELNDLIDRHNATLVLHDMPDGENDTPTPGCAFVYMRFHGPHGDCHGQYDGRYLRAAADRISDWLKAGKTVYGFFNNDADGYAPFDAQNLKGLIDDN